MNTTQYKGWMIHETFLSDSVRPQSVKNGIRIQSPEGVSYSVTSMHAAKCLISRLVKGKTA